MLKISAFYLEKQKSVIPKKLARFNIKTNKQTLFTDPIFSDGLALEFWKISWESIVTIMTEKFHMVHITEK